MEWSVLMTPYPLVWHPVYKDYVWGGARIPRVFHRDLPDGVYAESWEIADRPEGMSVVARGPLRGRSELRSTRPFFHL